jgi:hypothetical protein
VYSSVRIAEHVAKIYPELVVRDQAGRIDGVPYDELTPMLLNEMQMRSTAQDARIRDLEKQVAELRDLKQQMVVMSAELRRFQRRAAFVAMR